MLTRVKSIIIAGAVALGAVAFAGTAQAGIAGAGAAAKKSVAGQTTGIKAERVHYQRICRPIFRHRWTPYGWRRVFVGRRCWNHPHRHYGYRYYGRGYRWGRPGWRRGYYGPRWRHGWRRGGPRIVLRFGR